MPLLGKSWKNSNGKFGASAESDQQRPWLRRTCGTVAKEGSARQRSVSSKAAVLGVYVLQSVRMGNTITVRLPQELIDRLRKKSRRTGLPVGRVVRQAVETSLDTEESNPLLEFAGLIKGGPREVSSRKGFSRG